MATKKSPLQSAETTLREIGMGYPEVHEDFPWGHRALKVKGKAFVFMGIDDDGRLFLSVKLPASHGGALMLPFAKPTGYGLGKSGWVSASFSPGDDVPMGLLSEWLDESYRAVAPKRLVASLSTGEQAPAGKITATKKTATKKAPVREPA